jgi:hypothetical protein
MSFNLERGLLVREPCDTEKKDVRSAVKELKVEI